MVNVKKIFLVVQVPNDCFPLGSCFGHSRARAGAMQLLGKGIALGLERDLEEGGRGGNKGFFEEVNLP